MAAFSLLVNFLGDAIDARMESLLEGACMQSAASYDHIWVYHMVRWLYGYAK